jgi:hypothetical protein
LIQKFQGNAKKKHQVHTLLLTWDATHMWWVSSHVRGECAVAEPGIYLSRDGIKIIKYNDK